MWGLERLNRIWLLTVSCCARQTDVKLAGSQFEGSSQFLFEAHRQDCGQQLCRVSKSIWVNSQKYILGDTNYRDITFVFLNTSITCWETVLDSIPMFFYFFNFFFFPNNSGHLLLAAVGDRGRTFGLIWQSFLGVKMSDQTNVS